MTDTETTGEQDASSATRGQSPKEMAAAAAQAVKQEAQSFAASAQDKARDKVEQTRDTATRTLGDFANAVRKAGDELSQSDQSMASRLVQKAADGLEGLSRTVSDKRPEELLDAVRDFGRRNPTAFIAGSVLVGLAIGRFIKSSGESRRPDSFSRLESAGYRPGEAPFGQSATSPAATSPTASSSAVGAPPYGGESSVGPGDANLGVAADEYAGVTDDIDDLDDADGTAPGAATDRSRFSPEV
jgi:hypothetical protein